MGSSDMDRWVLWSITGRNWGVDKEEEEAAHVVDRRFALPQEKALSCDSWEAHSDSHRHQTALWIMVFDGR